MHDAHEFLRSLTVVLCVAAVSTMLFQLLRQPVVLGYLIAGLIIGPHVPIPFVADPGIVQTLSELGVILLMFALGLEFSLRRLIQVGPTAGLTAIVQSSLMVWLGFLVGRAFGWTVIESVFCGAIMAISSTTIIAKAFDEQNVRGRLREFVVGVLIVEDLIAIVLLAVLAAVATGSEVSAGDVGRTVLRLALFLAGLLTVGMLLVPRLMRHVERVGRPEITVIASIGVCFAAALLALEFGFSVALGAFLAGSLIAESGRGHAIEHAIQPIRDMFAAIFFVSVGMLIEPALVAQYWLPITVLTALVVVGKIAGVTVGSFLSGNGLRLSVQSGMSLAQIGEFSFIIAGLGVASGAIGSFLYPVAVAVSAVTTLTTPLLIRTSGPAASWLDRRLPPRLQTYAALYGSWLEALKSAPRPKTSGARIRRLVGLLLLDALLLFLLILGATLVFEGAVARVLDYSGLEEGDVRLLLVVAVLLACAPFAFGVLRLSRGLAAALADQVFAGAPGRTDLAAAPRRALVVGLQLAIVSLVLAPLIAVAQPFLPGIGGTGLLLLPFALLLIALWRSASNLEGHARAGAQVVVEALARQSASGRDHGLEAVQQLLPGMGAPTSVRIHADSPAVGRTLGALDLRGLTGAFVLAIEREGRGVVMPGRDEVLRAGDDLALAGTHEAIEAARALLDRPTRQTRA